MFLNLSLLLNAFSQTEYMVSLEDQLMKRLLIKMYYQTSEVVSSLNEHKYRHRLLMPDMGLEK